MNKIDSRANERGAVSIKTLLTFLLIAAIGFSAWKVLPIYTEQRQIIYDVDELANKAAVRNLKEDEIKKAIETIRVRYSLPENSISLVTFGQSKMQISLAYTKAIDFIVTTYNWKVDHMADGKAI
jgi:hypothetical protein